MEVFLRCGDSEQEGFDDLLEGEDVVGRVRGDQRVGGGRGELVRPRGEQHARELGELLLGRGLVVQQQQVVEGLVCHQENIIRDWAGGKI